EPSCISSRCATCRWRSRCSPTWISRRWRRRSASRRRRSEPWTTCTHWRRCWPSRTGRCFSTARSTPPSPPPSWASWWNTRRSITEAHGHSGAAEMTNSRAAQAVDYGPEEAAMRAYLREGERRAYELGNRGPIRLTADGKVHPEILDAYWRCGFYVFEGVLGTEELAEIEADLFDILDRLPTERDSPLDGKGRPALGSDCSAPTLFWSKPLGDPFGGTSLANGRHPIKMFEPEAAADAPKEVVYLILGSLQFSEAALRVYGHPQLLVAAAINGEDFVPFTDAFFIKEPGRGASVAWHQDGVTHWDSPDWDEGSHGF